MRFLLCWCSSWHLHSSAFYFWSFRNAQKFCVSEPEPLPVAVLPLLLAFFLSGPSNQSMNWFWGGENPSLTQPLSTCWWFCTSQHLGVLWMGSAPAGCWGGEWGREAEQGPVGLGSFVVFAGVPQGSGCRRPRALRSLGCSWNHL